MDVSAIASTERLLRSLPVAMVFVDRAGVVFEATERVRDILGCTPADLKGRRLSSLFPDAIHHDLEATLGQWISEGSSAFDGRVVRLPVITASGEVVEVGVRIHLSETGFAVALLDQRSAGDGLRASLLDAVSAPRITGGALNAVTAEIGRAFDWDLGAVWVVDVRSMTLRAAAVWERDTGWFGGYRSSTLERRLAVGEGLPGAAWELDEVVLVDGETSDPRFASMTQVPRAGAAIPIRSGRRIVGVFELLAKTDAEVRLWLASEADAISSGLGQIVERFRDRVHADAVESRLALALAAGEFGVWSLDVRSGRAEWSSLMADLHAVSATEGGADDVFAAVNPSDRASVGRTLERARAVGEPQLVEYRVRDADRGTVWIATRVTRVQANGDPPLLSAVSSDVTERKRAELSLQRRRAAVESLQWVSQAIIAGRRLGDTAIAVANAATGVLGADLGIVIYPEPSEVGSDLSWVISGLPSDQAPPALPPGVDLESVTSTTRGVEVVRDLRRHERGREFLRSLGVPLDVTELRSVLFVPVGGRSGRPLGLMIFAHADRNHFTEDDARLAASIGSTTGVAIENARRHEEQRMAAVAFQRQMLPGPVAAVPGAELCIRYHPGHDGFDIGGDWYDVIELGEGRLGLAVGDVCGHGLTAAAHMGQFRYSFRALIQSSSTPEDAFRVVNRMALHEVGTTATVAYAEVDVRTGDCAVWSCGHLPPLVASPDGSGVRWLEDLDARGPMLGFVDCVDPKPIRTTLEPGELLLLYTDGLVERRGESIDDGLARLAGSFAGRSPHLDQLCDELHEVLTVAGPHADDTVLLGIRRT